MCTIIYCIGQFIQFIHFCYLLLLQCLFYKLSYHHTYMELSSQLNFQEQIYLSNEGIYHCQLLYIQHTIKFCCIILLCNFLVYTKCPLVLKRLKYPSTLSNQVLKYPSSSKVHQMQKYPSILEVSCKYPRAHVSQVPNFPSASNAFKCLCTKVT